MKTTNKDIKQLVNYGYAIDITNETSESIQQIKDLENGFNIIAYSMGQYGRNGMIYQGRKTKQLYAITARVSNIFYIGQ